MVAGLCLSWIASLLGGLPILRVELTGARPRVQDMMASLVVRLFAVLAGALYVVLVGLVERTPFVLWVGLSYLLLLPVDVRYVLRGGPGVEDER